MRNLTLKFFLVVMLSLVLLAGCAAGPNPNIKTSNQGNNIAGFWLGLWHGIISFITFIISLFSENVNLYEVHNNGGWYNFGFVLGAGIVFGGSSSRIPSKKVKSLLNLN